MQVFTLSLRVYFWHRSVATLLTVGWLFITKLISGKKSVGSLIFFTEYCLECERTPGDFYCHWQLMGMSSFL